MATKTGKLKCQVLTPDRTVFDGELDMVVVTNIDGEIGILRNHAPLVGALDYGEARLKSEGRTERYVVYGGLVEVLNNKAMVLAAGVEPVAQLDLATVRRELADAEAEAPEGAAAIAERAERLKRAKACLKVLEKVSESQSHHE